MSAPFPLYSWLLGEVPDVNLEIRLYQSILPFFGIPTPAYFVEAVFPGYEPKSLSYPLGYGPLPNGSLYASLPNMSWFVRPGEGQGCTVQGIYITTAEPDEVSRLVSWLQFDAPQSLQTPADWISLDVSFAATQLLTPSA